MNSPVAWAILFHILGFVLWIGALLTVTLTLGVHTVEPSAEATQVLGELEMKLLKRLAHPGAALTVVAGAAILWFQPSYLREDWLLAKLTLVVTLIVVDLMVTVRARAFCAGRTAMRRRTPQIQWGAISAIFLMILVLVMIKPAAPWALAVPVLVGILALGANLLPDR